MDEGASRARRPVSELAAELKALRESIGPGSPSISEILADSRRELELRALRPFPHMLTDDDRAFLARQDELARRGASGS